jgi:hypothetical protein
MPRSTWSALSVLSRVRAFAPRTVLIRTDVFRSCARIVVEPFHTIIQADGPKTASRQAFSEHRCQDQEWEIGLHQGIRPTDGRRRYGRY